MPCSSLLALTTRSNCARACAYSNSSTAHGAIGHTLSLRLSRSAVLNGSSASNKFFYSTSGSKPSPDESGMKVIYVGPLNGAVKAVKVFSLITAVGAMFGGPILTWLGNPSVPLAARIMMSSIVMLVGLGTTALMHWIVKGVVTKGEGVEEVTFLWQ